MQKPSLARFVLVVGAAAQANGADTAPAVVTRVFGEHPDGGWVINATVFRDAQSTPLPLTSIRLYDTEAEARAQLPASAAYWPPRV